MSRALPYLAGVTSKTAAFDAASKVLSSVGLSLKSVPVHSSSSEINSAISSAGGVALAGPLSKDELRSLSSKLSSPIHTTTIATGVGASLNPDATYADADFTVVRSVSSSPEGVSIPYAERVDKFGKYGISTAAEVESVKEGMVKTAEIAVNAAKEKNASKITVMLKPQSAVKTLNALFLQVVKEAGAKAGVSVEVQTSQQVLNAAVMFSKTLGVVTTPDYTAADILEDVAAGVSGGVGMASEVHRSDAATLFAAAHAEAPAKFSPGSNPTGLLIAASGALKQMGMVNESEKVLAALKKVYSAKSSLPSDIQGGKADAAAFGTAVAGAM